jgi:hypothetical protein
MTSTPHDTTELGPWGVHRVPEGGEVSVEVGPLLLRLAQEDGEIRVAAFPDDMKRDDEPDWIRWAPANWRGELALTPAFPDRTLVIQPEDAFWLLAGAEARIYVKVPLWVRIEALGDKRTPLISLPTLEASDTWWGTLEEGELCYWIRTAARRRIVSGWASHIAVCPLQLVNRSDDDLNVDKIALRVEYLSLYADGGRTIWADETRVLYLGESEGSRLEVAGSPPAEAPRAELLVPPRIRMAKGLRARTFARLRSIQGWI